MLFGSTSRRFGTISIFASIPMATYRIMHVLRKVVQRCRCLVSQPVAAEARVGGMGFSESHSLSAPLPADTLHRRPVTVSGDASASLWSDALPMPTIIRRHQDRDQLNGPLYPPKADIRWSVRHVRFVPSSELCAAKNSLEKCSFRPARC